jgi:hypothetical protein
LGATVAVKHQQPSASMHHRSPLEYALAILIALLLPVAAVACLAGMVLFVFISLFFMGIFLGALHGLFALLALLKGWALA